MDRGAKTALFLERYLGSLLFLYFAWTQHGPFFDALDQWWSGFRDVFPTLVNRLLIMSLQLAAGMALLINRAPVRPPQDWREIAVPFAGTFFYVVYNFAPSLPPPFSSPLVPDAWRIPLAGAALLVSSIGYGIAVWGALSLGRSFAVLVAVRTVVCRGPYRFVRHPIYSGYVLHLASLVLSQPTAGLIVLVAIHLTLTVWRARLEEASLLAHSPEYREYIQRAGFLLPRWGRSEN